LTFLLIVDIYTISGQRNQSLSIFWPCAAHLVI
jgi:hypothetical protein